MQVKEPKYYQVLHKHYMLHHTFEKISTDTGISYRTVLNLHGEALKVFEKALRAKK